MPNCSIMSTAASLLVLSCTLFSCLSTFQALQTDTKTNDISHAPFVNNLQSQNEVKNIIDSCWRSDPKWEANRKALAECAKGFGSNAIGGKNGNIYVVHDPSDNATHPQPGTLRHGLTRSEPLWIIFDKDMVIQLENELMLNSYKTIDGRGANINITNGPCITIDNVAHVIVHGISIHDCTRGTNGWVDRGGHLDLRNGSDPDAINIHASTDIWVDHCYLASCGDGLLDINHASTNITVSNNRFSNHNKVMLYGHDDNYTVDRGMRVTLAFNHFGPNLTQRIPRVRQGYAHVANNYYDPWNKYAIGGSADPTIFSQGNYFTAPDIQTFKEVTRRDPEDKEWVWKQWKWRSSEDIFNNGAYFIASGDGDCLPHYHGPQDFAVAKGSEAPSLTSDAGPLHCVVNNIC